MKKILLVEDNEMNRDMLARRLQKRGYEMLMADDGLVAVEMTTKLQPDLVLMDMSLPGLDGWEASRRLKADPATVAIPIIALTAHAMAEDREKALAAGCDEFETKPVDLTSLLAKMETLLANPGIVRNKLKVASAVTNAQAFIGVQEEFGSFDAYIWRSGESWKRPLTSTSPNRAARDKNSNSRNRASSISARLGRRSVTGERSSARNMKK